MSRSKRKVKRKSSKGRKRILKKKSKRKSKKKTKRKIFYDKLIDDKKEYSNNFILKIIPSIGLTKNIGKKEILSQSGRKITVNDYIDIFSRKKITEIKTKYANIIKKYIKKKQKQILKEITLSEYNNLKKKQIKIKNIKFSKNILIFKIKTIKPITGSDLYILIESIDSGADTWGEGDIVLLNYNKIKKLKLGNIDKNLSIDVFYLFDKLEIDNLIINKKSSRRSGR